MAGFSKAPVPLSAAGVWAPVCFGELLTVWAVLGGAGPGAAGLGAGSCVEPPTACCLIPFSSVESEPVSYNLEALIEMHTYHRAPFFVPGEFQVLWTFGSHTAQDGDNVGPQFQLKHLRFGDAKWLAQDHTGSKQRAGVWSRLSYPEPVVSASVLPLTFWGMQVITISFPCTWLDGLTDWRDLGCSKLRELVKGREAWCAAARGVTMSQTRFSDWTKAIIYFGVLYYEKIFLKAQLRKGLPVWLPEYQK